MNGEPRGTVRCHRLFGRSRIARERWLQRTETRQILNHFLSSSSLPYNDQSGCPIETDPILSASATMEISPGEKAQHLHRDDFIWQQTHLDSRELYTKGSDVGMGILVPGVKTTRANGATAVSPPWGPVFAAAIEHPHPDRHSLCPGHTCGATQGVQRPRRSSSRKWKWVKPSSSLGPRSTEAERTRQIKVARCMASSFVARG